MEKRDSRNSSGSSAWYRLRFGDEVSSCNIADVMRVVRLLLESLETAFFLANIYLECYGLTKIFDIINQIIPTAYVYNTGYWVFYKNQYRQSICVCNRFGIRCPHERNELHFVNLNPLFENVQNYFLTPFFGKLYPLATNIKVTPILSDILRAYDVKITVTVQQLRFDNNKFMIVSNEKASFSMETRYILTPEHYPLENTTIQFEPSPMAHPAYTSYFQTMERLNTFPTTTTNETQIPRTYTIVSADLPRFGMISNDEIYGPPPPYFSNRNASNLGHRNNSVFPGGFSNIWTSPEDNSCNIMLLGGCVSHITLNSIRFCTKQQNRRFEQNGPLKTIGQNETANKHHRHVRMEINGLQQNIDQHPSTFGISFSSLKNDEKVSVLNPLAEEYNFLGINCENIFPSLPQPCNATNKSAMTENKKAQPTKTDANNSGESSKTDTSIGERTYAQRVASVKIVMMKKRTA